MIHLQKTKSFPELRKAQFQTADESPTTVDAVDLTPGTRLGRYVVLYRIGSGGMGVVYAAYDPELDRKVALKLLTRHLDREQAAALTRREAQAMARLAHPNVVTVHDVYSYDDRVFIAMEYLEGQTLKDWLAGESRPWPSVLEVFLQAGRGLAAAHAVDLIHLDFKPGNVMLTDDGGVRVLDFGLAQLDLDNEEKGLATFTEVGEASETLTEDTPPLIAPHRDIIRGTPAYLAPERLLLGAADARSDQFSLCVALYEALYGERPFAGESLEEVLARIERGTVREPTSKRLPVWLRQALMRGLSHEPEDRFEDMEGLLDALSPAPHRIRRRRVLGGVSTLIAGLILIFSWAFDPDQDPVPVCDGATERLTGVWDVERKEAVRVAFLGAGTALVDKAIASLSKTLDSYRPEWDKQGVQAAFSKTGLGFAERNFGRVSKILDRFSQDWVEQHTEACAATHVRGEQSERMLDLRMMCLDWRLDEVQAVVSLLTEVDARAMATSVEAVQSLSRLEDCGDRLELMNWQRPPADSGARQAIDKLRADIVESSMRWKAQGVAQHEAMASHVVRARQLAYPPVEAYALFVSAETQLGVGQFEGAEASFQQALLAAMRAGDRVLQARVYGGLVKAIGGDLHRSEEARWWGDAGLATLSALGPGHELARLEVYEAAGWLAQATGDLEQGERLTLQALEIAERLWGDDDYRLARLLNTLALSLEPGRRDEKGEFLERASAILEAFDEQLGPIAPLGSSRRPLRTTS